MKKTSGMLCSLVLILVAAGAGCMSKPRINVGVHQVSGPYAHSNLAIYVVHGPDRLTGWKFLTMAEAIEQKKLVVHETGNVEELMVENKSSDEHIYMQSGEIVKGGKQDRTLKYDHLIPPKSGKEPIASFCVDEGRWAQRGEESAEIFAAGALANTNELRVAIKGGASQGKVWAKVRKSQRKMRISAISNADLDAEDMNDIFDEEDGGGESVDGIFNEDGVGTASHQRVAGHEKVRELVKDYVGTLSKVIDDNQDAVGFAYAVNGEIIGADLYGSRALFRKLWPKLRDATAQEAFGELDKDKAFDTPAVRDVKAFILAARRGGVTEKKISPKVILRRRETDESLLFELRRAGSGESIHDAFHRKTGEEDETDEDKWEDDEENEGEDEGEGEGSGEIDF